MKHFAIFLVLLASGCSSGSPELITFEHPLLSIEYPNGWVNLEQEGMILAIRPHQSLLKGTLMLHKWIKSSGW